MAGTAAINASVGGLYGKLLNKWREILKYEHKQVFSDMCKHDKFAPLSLTIYTFFSDL